MFVCQHKGNIKSNWWLWAWCSNTETNLCDGALPLVMRRRNILETQEEHIRNSVIWPHPSPTFAPSEMLLCILQADAICTVRCCYTLLFCYISSYCCWCQIDWKISYGVNTLVAITLLFYSRKKKLFSFLFFFLFFYVLTDRKQSIRWYCWCKAYRTWS